MTEKFALRFAYMQEERDSYLTGYYDGSQPDHRFLPQDVRGQFQPVTDQSQLRSSTDYQRYLGCQAWQAGCWYDPGWQIGNPQTKVKADEETFYNNVDNYAYRISAAYQFSEATTTIGESPASSSLRPGSSRSHRRSNRDSVSCEPVADPVR